MSLYFIVIAASLLQALVSFSGALLAIFNEARVRSFAHVIVSFAVGALLGVTFFDIIPEALEMTEGEFGPLAIFLFAGILLFFIIEKFFLWHDHHTKPGENAPQSYTTLVLWGDFFHNFIDGIILALTFLVDIRLGVITTLAVLLHEIPQEVSDFGILLHGGVSRRRALIYNFLVSLSTVAGAIFTLAAGRVVEPFLPYGLAIIGGNFLYLAIADLMPELREAASIRHTLAQIAFMCLGVFLVVAPDLFLG